MICVCLRCRRGLADDEGGRRHGATNDEADGRDQHRCTRRRRGRRGPAVRHRPHDFRKGLLWDGLLYYGTSGEATWTRRGNPAAPSCSLCFRRGHRTAVPSTSCLAG